MTSSVFGHTATHTSELVVPPTKMLWDAGLVSSGFSGATEVTRRESERGKERREGVVVNDV